MPVYFLRAGETPYVKIGFATYLDSRLSAIKCSNHEPITVLRLLDGDRDDELRIHRLLKQHRHRGEWFRLTDVQAFQDFGLEDIHRPIPDPKPRSAISGELHDLHQRIEGAIFASGMSASGFGKAAANCQEAVWRLRRGMSISKMKIKRFERYLSQAGAA